MILQENLQDNFLARPRTRFNQNLTRKLSCAKLLQDLIFLARNASFLVQGLQDIMKNLARNILPKFAYFL